MKKLWTKFENSKAGQVIIILAFFLLFFGVALLLRWIEIGINVKFLQWWWN